jgi:prephenate dehydrogenase
MKKLQDTTFAVVGLGLIGGSYVKALKNLKVKRIIGMNRNPVVAMMAKDEGYITDICDKEGKLLQEADVIINAYYPKAFLTFVKEQVKNFKPDVLLTDVMGIKADFPEQVDAMLRPGMDFVSGHPMAGREGKGYGQSAAEIFNNANYILIKRDGNKPENVAFLKDMAMSFGCKRVVELTTKEHDGIIAYTSDLPHIMAVSLVNSDSLQPNTKYFIAGSFRDATRVADINAGLWKDLFLLNRDKVRDEIHRLKVQLDKWDKALAENDEETLVTMMEEAKRKREDLFNAKNFR